MNDELKIRSILSRIEALHDEVASLLPKTVPVAVPESAPTPVPAVVVQVEPMSPPPLPERSAFYFFWTKVEDWICVRGDFAPKRMTREFAVATRWLTRIGAFLSVTSLSLFEEERA